MAMAAEDENPLIAFSPAPGTLPTSTSRPPRTLSSIFIKAGPTTQEQLQLGRDRAEEWIHCQPAPYESDMRIMEMEKPTVAGAESSKSVNGKMHPVEVTERELEPMSYRRNPTRKGIDWRSPASMLFAFFIGMVAAVGQHIFYSSLSGRPVGDTDHQQRMLRYVVVDPCWDFQNTWIR